MQRTPTKTSGGEHWWWAAAAAAAIGLALYGWAPTMARADGESPPYATPPPSAPASSAELATPTPAPAQASQAFVQPSTDRSAAAPWVITAASSAVRRVRAVPLALPEGAAAPLLPLGQSTVAVVGQRAVEVAPGRTQSLLTLRDTQTGQIHYRLSLLRVELQPGADPLALAQAVPGSRLDFGNQVYALLEVEPEKLGVAYRQLQADARVLSVSLKAYTPPAHPK